MEKNPVHEQIQMPVLNTTAKIPYFLAYPFKLSGHLEIRAANLFRMILEMAISPS